MEVLIVTAIAAMILSGVFIYIRDAKAKSRDAQREHDIKQIQNALSMYVVNQGIFPVCELTVIDGTSDCLSSVLVGELLMPAVPTDPLHGSTGVCGADGSYVYCYQSLDGSTYSLQYNLETNSIPGKPAGWQQVGP